MKGEFDMTIVAINLHRCVCVFRVIPEPPPPPKSRTAHANRSRDWTVLNVVTLGESWENNTQVNEWQLILYMFCCMMNIYIFNDPK